MKKTTVNLETLRLECRDAALGELPWEALLSNICEWVGGDRAMMMHASHGKPYKASFSYNHDLSVLASYNANYNGNDPRMPYSKLTLPGYTRTGQQYVPNSKIEHTDYFNEISRNTDILDSVHSVISDTPISGRQAISIHRGFDNEFFDSAHVERMQILLPHLTDAYQYAIKVSGKIGAAIENEDCSILINTKLRGLLLNGDPLSILMGCESLNWNGEYLRPKNQVLREFLSLAIERAKIRITSQCRLQVTDPLISEVRPFIQISVLPRPRLIDWLPNVEDMVMLHIVRLQDSVQNTNIDIFCKVFKLTKSETRTLNSILKTTDLRHAAQQSNVSYETLRWHLKNIFQKTGYNKKDKLLHAISQMDLSNTE